jgi:hypothetical protein
MAAFFLFASENFLEFSFVGCDAHEAYQMHHHDKVIISIPDEWKREDLWETFATNPDVFMHAHADVEEDWSEEE